MNSFFQLWMARNKEFYRDRGSLSWAFLFPILVIIGCAVAFSEEDNQLLTIGSYPAEKSIEQFDVLTQGYSKIIAYNDLEKAKSRLQHHQLHALVQTDKNIIWLNPQSSESSLVKQLIQNNPHNYQVKEISGEALRYVDWVIPGVLGMNIMFGSLFGVGYVLVRYRKNGVLKRLQATPVTAFEFLSAQIASRLFIVVSANALIFIGSDIALDLMVEGNRLELLLLAIVGAASMISLGLLIACRTASEELAGGILNTATWPMMFLSGIWFSLDDTPDAMQQLAYCLPLTHLVDAARDIMINGATLIDVIDHVAIMLIMGLVCLSLAAYFFRWHK